MMKSCVAIVAIVCLVGAAHASAAPVRAGCVTTRDTVGDQSLGNQEAT